MNDVISFFTGHNIYAWLFIIVCCIGAGVLSTHQRRAANLDHKPTTR